MKLLIIVLAMLVTAVGALHSWYSKDLYVKAALLSEAYSIASDVKTRVSDHFIEFGVMPNSNMEAEIAVPNSLFGTSVSSVNIRQGGVIEVGFDANGKVGEGSMLFSPLVSPVSGYLYWECYSDSIDRNVLQTLRPGCDHKPATLESDLSIAIGDQNLQALEKLLQLDVDPNGFTHGVTPLMYASNIGDLELVNRLIERGVEIDLQADNHDGLTALMIAIRKQRIDITSTLLANGASASMSDKHGRMAAYHAKQVSDRHGDERFYTALQQVQNPQFLLHPAESFSSAITNYNSTHKQEALKQKLRLLADECLYTTVATLKLQIEASCETAMSKWPNLTSEKPEIALTILNLAIEELAEPILLEYIDDFVVSAEQVNSKGRNGQTSLIKAITLNKPEVASLLIDRGADVNVLSSRSSSPLIEAGKLGDARLVRHLMSEGADLNAVDSLGRTALLAAVGRGHQSVVDVLIQAGAETRATDANGIDAFLLAKNQRFFAIEQLLLTAKGI